MVSRQTSAVGLARRSAPKPSRQPDRKPDKKPPARPNPRKPTRKPERPRRKEPRPRPVPKTPKPPVKIPAPEKVPVQKPKPKEYGKVAGRTFQRIVKANHFTAMAFTAGGLLAWYLTDEEFNLPGFQKCCELPPVIRDATRIIQGNSTAKASPCSHSTNCGVSLQVPTGEGVLAAPAVDRSNASVYGYQVVFYGPYNHTTNRMVFAEKWARKIPPRTIAPQVEPELIPIFEPVPIPDSVPWVSWDPPPFIPPNEPLPLAPPLNRPTYDPTPKNPYDPFPEPWIGERPSIDFEPFKPPTPGVHEERPPEPPEKEGKKRLSNTVAAGWTKFLKKAVGGYTESDDFITAIYKGLPWQLRRWRGRDGVWRDRDITSKTRAERIYKEFGNLDINKAIGNVAVDQLTDMAYGKVGNALSNRARELGKEGLWSGSGGFQRGSGLTRDQWEKLYAKLKREQGAKVAPGRHYRVNEYDRKTNTWTRKLKYYNSRTTIPWYRQKSTFSRPHSGYWGTRPLTRHYYASKATPAPYVKGVR